MKMLRIFWNRFEHICVPILLGTKSLPVIITEQDDAVETAVSEVSEVIEKGNNGNLGIVIVIILLVVLIVVLACCFAFFLYKYKNMSDAIKRTNLPGQADNSVSAGKDIPDKMTSKSEPIPESHTEIVLTNLENASLVYRAQIVDRLLVGRKAEADISIASDKAVSSEHCAFTKKGLQIYLEDCDSTNGTLYNGQEVTEQIPILSGGVLEIGYAQYRVNVENKC